MNMTSISWWSSRCYNVLSHSSHHVFPGSEASPQHSSETPWASCWCSTWPTSRVFSTSGTGWVCVSSNQGDNSNLLSQPPVKDFLKWRFKFAPACLPCTMQIFWKLLSSSGQLQANAYCDNPDIVLVGTKADLRDLRDVHARQAKELADRYGWDSFALLVRCWWQYQAEPQFRVHIWRAVAS